MQKYKLYFPQTIEENINEIEIILPPSLKCIYLNVFVYLS